MGKILSYKMASVAVGIRCMGPLGGKQGFLPYPSGPSQHSIAYSLGHLFQSISCTVKFFLDISCLPAYSSVCLRCVEKINDLSFFLSFKMKCNNIVSREYCYLYVELFNPICV